MNRSWYYSGVAAGIVMCVALALGSSLAVGQNFHYGLRYDMTLRPEEGRAEVSLTVDERVNDNIWAWHFHIDPQRHDGFEGDGRIETKGSSVSWTPPTEGGRLSFHLPVDSRRNNGRFDARMTEDWALFRGDDLFPAARTDQREEAEADATLHVHLPERWTFVSAYPEIDDDVYRIEHEHRSFDRPTGWMAAGRLGVRRERIAGVRVAVAGPFNQGVRRMDLLAHLNWNLPAVRRIVPDMPKRLLIVSAGDPMWRGGLSGPNSLYLHADRNLISENGTSPLVHEVMHVVTGMKAEEGADWIVEGVAEYYSLKIMWRSGTITEPRFAAALENLAEWAEEADRLDVARSSGAVTARAVGVLRKLDLEIEDETGDKQSLDDVVSLLSSEQEKVSLIRLRKAVVEVMGNAANTLSSEELGIKPGEK